MTTPYRDRRDAGRALAEALRERNYAGRLDLLVLGLPRGGVPVAYEVAAALDAELDIMLVRKLGVPGHEELAMGAIASGGVRVDNDAVIRRLSISRDAVDQAAERELRELERRERAYRGEDRTPPTVSGRCVILVDDGLATGSTMLAAVEAIKKGRPALTVVAVPVAPPETCKQFEEQVDDIVCAATPETFHGVGQFYQEFDQTTDDEVRELLRRAWERGDYAPDEPMEVESGDHRTDMPDTTRQRARSDWRPPHGA